MADTYLPDRLVGALWDAHAVILGRLVRDRRTTVGCRLFLALAACAAAIAFSGSDETLGATGARSPAARFVSPAGSDAGPCTQTAPCASFDRAYLVAKPGQTVDVAAGSYPAQIIEWRPGRDDAAQVVFRPTGKVSIEGDLKVFASGVWIAGHATGTIADWRSRTYSITVSRDIAVLAESAAKHPHNVTLEGIDGGALGTYSGENVVARDIDSGPVVEDASCSRPEPTIGPNIDAELFVPRNITWERVVDHGMDLTAEAVAGGCHHGGLFIVSADRVTIRDSVFTENVVYDIQVQNYVGVPASNVTIENSWFGCPVLSSFEAPGKVCNNQNSIQFNARSTFSNWLIRFNSFSGSESVNANGGEASFSNVRLVGNAGKRPAKDVCGQPGVSFSTNAWLGGKCGASDVSLSSSPFVNGATGQEDLHLLRGTRASGIVVGASADAKVAWDIEGRMRPIHFGRDAGSVQRESAEIVPGQAIGGARLGMTREDALAFYGRPKRSSTRGGIRTDTYRVHRATLWLGYREDHAVIVGTTSGYYTTRTGFGPTSPASDARRLLKGRWDACRGIYRRPIGGGIVYMRPDRAERKILAVSVVSRSAEEPCTKEH